MSQEQFDDEEWQLKKLALAKRGAAAMIAAVQPRAAKTIVIYLNNRVYSCYWDISLLCFSRAPSEQISFDHLICVIRPTLPFPYGFQFRNFSYEIPFFRTLLVQTLLVPFFLPL